jgi:chorismate lyase/3-hydroxybenzoate synthase
MNVSPPRADSFFFRFGDDSRRGIGARLAVPVLAGEAAETLFGDLAKCDEAGGFELFGGAGDWLIGVRMEPVAADIGAQTESIYREMLALVNARGRRLARVWNYVPRINATSAEGLETYRVFCRGRALAFERAGWSGPLPAASAVGGAAGVLAVVFAATRAEPMARENPEQVPAYEYPADYGPRSPSFSRAMQVSADGRKWTFLSGTAAIKGHETQAEGDLAGQIACTLDNLRLVSRECGLGEDLGAERVVAGGAGEGVERHFKVYLRDAAKLAEARAALEGEGGLLRAGDRVTWLHADICRADLEIEIEATVIG